MSQLHFATWLKLLDEADDVAELFRGIVNSFGSVIGAERLTLQLCDESGSPVTLDWRQAIFKAAALPQSRRIEGFVGNGRRARASLNIAGKVRWGQYRYSEQSLVIGPAREEATLRIYWGAEKTFALSRQAEQYCVAFFRNLIGWSCALSWQDPATALPNHLQLTNDLIKLAADEPGTEASLVLIELLDHEVVRKIFKGAGSEATDHLLLDIAQRLRKLLQGKSRLYYVGVGRFAMVAHRTGADLAELLGVIENLLGMPFESGPIKVRLGSVMGIVKLDETMDDPADGLRRATVSAQQAKAQRLSHHRYDPEFDRKQIRSYGLLQDIPRALENDEFKLVFQPKLQMRSGAYSSAEALLRWDHPTLGPISPGEFIPLAENTELIHPITRWVVEASVRALCELRRRGVILSIALNVSAHNLGDTRFAGFLLDAVRRHDVSPAYLQIECTEYSALASETCTRTLHEISQAGFIIALDDFGAGYSNLSCLNDLPINYLKIDQSLVFLIATNMRSLQLLDGIVQLGKSLGYHLVAEGVETEAVFSLLESLKVDEIQGYLLSKPLPMEQLIDFVQDNPGR